jgi:hypothetical protein
VPNEPAKGGFWTSWGIPILLALGVAAALAFLVMQQTEMSFPPAFALSAMGVLGIGAYFLGVQQLYGSAAHRLGWECEIRPQPLPKGARQDVDIVIHGVFQGRPFTLFRETPKRTGKGRNSGYYSGLQWTGDEIRVPSFALHVSPGPHLNLDGVVGSERMAKSLIGLIGRSKERPRVEFETESNLSRRSELSSENAVGARSLFSPPLCDELDPMVRQGIVEAEPGLLVVRRKGFPFPWSLQEFVAQGDGIRRVLAG